ECNSVLTVDSDPHFVISVPSKNDALCFNIQEEPGVVLNLVEDLELGQFFHGIDYEISNIHETKNPDKPDATMKVKNKLLTVTRGSQKDYKSDYRNGKKVPCWFVHSNAEGLIDGTHKDYIVSDIFYID
ncbi:hypothetical protein AB205_0053520, partial [Aquarana catesbeiana]